VRNLPRGQGAVRHCEEKLFPFPAFSGVQGDGSDTCRIELKHSVMKIQHKGLPAVLPDTNRGNQPRTSGASAARVNLDLIAAGILLATTTASYGQPRITRQPTNLSLSIGATATFRVAATTTNPPLTYQWSQQGTVLANATNWNLTLINIQPTNAAAYTVAVTDGDGTTNSNPATLDVDPTWTRIMSDPIVTDQTRGDDLAGVQFADYDNDGDQDLLLITATGFYNPIFHNNGDGTFQKLIEPSLQGVEAAAAAYTWGDYDNDSWLDLFVPAPETSSSGKNTLLHNNGDGSFTRVVSSPVVSEGGRSCFGAWGDYDRDGYLDLLVSNGRSTMATVNWFYKNEGGGAFFKVTSGSLGPLFEQTQAGYYRILAVWVDVDGDGWQDLFVTTWPNGLNGLYRNTGAGGFVKVTDEPLVTERNNWGEAAFADYDNDGDLDVLILTFDHANGSYTGPVALYRNDGQGHFAKMTATQIGPLANERVNSFSAAWGDYDNDGWLDVYIANGVQGGGSRPDLLYRNNGDGTFTKVTNGSPATEPGAGWGAVLLDLNNDGFLDVVSFKHAAPDNTLQRYYRNNGNSNNWLNVKCVGTASPRSGTGTKVRVKATIRGQSMWQLRVIDPGGFANAQNFTAHFGLGDATSVDVLRIEWTSGQVQELQNVPVKQCLMVTEPARLAMPSVGQLRIQCWKGMACTIESSPDLISWTPLATLTNLNLTGGMQWTDPTAPGRTAYFYRVVSP
jgi:enediyne biosynthesis protein E4